MSLTPHVTRLVVAVQELSLARTLEDVQLVVRSAARELVGADGATFVLREDEQCFYADEDAIEPLWKGLRFPLQACVSGWAMLHREAVAIPDIYADDRVPHAAYRPTFVKSMCMVPIRTLDPVGAIGTYWAAPHVVTEEELSVLRALADSTAVALESVSVKGRLESEQRSAVTDELTGLANRRGFRQLAEQALERVRRSGGAACLVFVDVDGLKEVNDQRGHDAGDRLLLRMRDTLRTAFRAEDVVARLGGDEFVVLAVGDRDPRDLMVRLRLAIAAQPVQDGFALHGSVGSAEYAPGATVEALLAEADAAMYLDKADRRERARSTT